MAICMLCAAAGASRAEPEAGSLGRRVGMTADAYLKYSVGRLMELQGALPEALVQYRRAAALQPDECSIQTAVGRVLFTLGRLEEALKPAASAAGECPDSSEAVALYAAVLLSSGRAAEVEALLEEAASRDDAPVELVVLLSQSLLAQGRVSEAEELLHTRAERDTLAPRIAYMRARALLDLDRPEDAVAELERANSLDPENAAVVELCTTVLASLGRQEEAALMLESFLRTTGARAKHSAALARAYGLLGRNDEALEAARAGLERFGETPGLLRVLGTVLLEENDVEGALSAYERMLELEPDSVQALNFIAYTLADNDIDTPRAVELAERAVELEPESGMIHDTLGWAYYRAGRFDDAVREIGKAVTQGELDPVVLEHLGDALAADGRLEDAVVAWQQALSLDPTGGPAAKIQQARARMAPGGTDAGSGE